MQILNLATNVILCFVVFFAGETSGTNPENKKIINKISFGSCLKVSRPQPVWNAINNFHPDLFIFLGDNVYADTKDPFRLRQAWQRLGHQSGYVKLKQQSIICAIWDDHDYGKNDAGKEFPIRKESQQIFLDFFDEPIDSTRRTSPGIYTEKTFGPIGSRLQLILLDTRFFRDPLIRAKERRPGKGPYEPTQNLSSTLLGTNQWEWLEKTFNKEADLRIVCSSIQFLSSEHGWETWGNFPHERKRLYSMIEKNNHQNIFFLSGDRHSAEFSMDGSTLPFPLWDLTSSSLNLSLAARKEENPYRVGNQFFEENFGVLEIEWTDQGPIVDASIRNVEGNILLKKRVLNPSLKKN